MSASADLDGTSDDDALAPYLERLGRTGSSPEGARMRTRLAAKLFGIAPAEPARVGRFELRDRLGAGAMGVVYEAWDPKLDRRVALKLLRDAPGRRRDPDSDKRLMREAKAMARLRHPNVVQVHEIGAHAGQVFVAMELIDGVSLRTWLEQRERSWRRVLEVFVEAGYGLAAAHQAGLVHRDFKPDNVLIEAGRVFVGDFGLARASNADLEGSEGLPEGSKGLPEGSKGLPEGSKGLPEGSKGLPEGTLPEATEGTLGAPEGTLTRTGTFVGTPAYMAPEAFDGATPDPRADQYSFCASLYEALYGERPWPGETISQLRAAKRGEPVKPPTRGRKSTVRGRKPTIPRWLRRLIARGLSPRPEHRFASMAELLDQLERGLRRTRWWRRDAWITLALVGSSLAGAWALARGLAADEPRAPAPCSEAAQQLEPVWNPDREARVLAALGAGELDYAGEFAARTVAALDIYAQRWIAGHHGACMATHVHGTQSARALDLRMRCLDRRRGELDALLARFEAPRAADRLNALRAVDALTPVAACDNLELLESTTPLPEDPRILAEVERLRAELDGINAALNTGNHAEIADAAEALLAAANELGYKPLAAEAGVALGMIRSRTGKPNEAKLALEQAIVDAQASGHDEFAARAVIAEIYVVGFQLRDIEGGERLVRSGRALLEHIGDPPGLLANYHRNVGTFEFAGDRLAEARAQFQDAIDLYTKIHGESHFAVAESRTNLAAVERRLGDLDAALALYERARRDLEAALGPAHPNLFTLQNNMAAALMLEGRDAEAEAMFRAALALASKTMADEHASIGHPYNNLGELLLRQRRYAEAIASYDQAIASWTRSLGDDHPLLAHSLTGRGLARFELGELDEARADLERAFAIRISRGGSTVALGETEFILARALAALGEPRGEVDELARRALERMGERDGDTITRADIRAWLATRKRAR